MAAVNHETRRSLGQMWLAASQVSYIGIFFGLAIAIGYFGGHWIEHRLGGAPWVSLVGLLFGVVAGFRELVRIAKRVMRDQEAADQAENGEGKP